MLLFVFELLLFLVSHHNFGHPQRLVDELTGPRLAMQNIVVAGDDHKVIGLIAGERHASMVRSLRLDVDIPQLYLGSAIVFTYLLRYALDLFAESTALVLSHDQLKL